VIDLATSVVIQFTDDPARRRSKRLQDLADAEALLEATPELSGELTTTEKQLLGRLDALA
jgi:hypothetical protein